MRESGRTLASLVARQHGVVSRQQLFEADLDRGRIDRAIAAGRLLPLHVGVYAVGHRPRTDLARWMAATLACDGVLSYHSAGAHHGLAVRDRGLTHITAPGHLRRPRISTHRATLDPADVTTHRGIRVTTVARTLIDLDAVLDGRAFDRLVRDAMFQRRFHDAQIRQALTRKRSRRLPRYFGDDAGTQSDLENLLLAICRRHRIRQPETQHGTSRRVDFIWHDEQLVVEAVLRYTEQDLTRRPREVATQIRRALSAARGARR